MSMTEKEAKLVDSILERHNAKKADTIVGQIRLDVAEGGDTRLEQFLYDNLWCMIGEDI